MGVLRVVGASFGGLVAREFAVTYPQQVERLALACTSAGGEGRSSYPLQKLLELPSGPRVAAELKLVDSRWDQRWLESHPVDRAIAEGMTAAGQDQQDSAAAAAYAAQLQAREGHDVWDRLDEITCPTLVGYGKYDGIAPARNSEKMASRIRGAELHGYEGGHGFFVPRPGSPPGVHRIPPSTCGKLNRPRSSPRPACWVVLVHPSFLMAVPLSRMTGSSCSYT